jgi:hypothetical protein
MAGPGRIVDAMLVPRRMSSADVSPNSCPTSAPRDVARGGSREALADGRHLAPLDSCARLADLCDHLPRQVAVDTCEECQLDDRPRLGFVAAHRCVERRRKDLRTAGSGAADRGEGASPVAAARTGPRAGASTIVTRAWIACGEADAGAGPVLGRRASGTRSGASSNYCSPASDPQAELASCAGRESRARSVTSPATIVRT